MNKYLLMLFIGWSLQATSQTNVDLKITCEGKPLCYWDITLKQGDVVVGSSKTDDQGMAYFKGIYLAYNTIDVYGNKNTANGQKDWNVRGYVDVDQSGNAHLEFKPFLDDMGIPVATAVAAWGLNEGGCSGGSPSASSGSSSTTESSSSSSESTSSSSSSDETTSTTEEPKSTQASAPLMTPQESLEAQKAMYENQVARSNSKISKLQRKLEDEEEGTKAHNDLLYDIRLEEIDKEISEKKLEKTELMIANNYAPIPKSQRGPIEDQIDALKDEEKELKQKQKDDIAFGTDEKLNVNAVVDSYGEEELADMGNLELRRAKMDQSTTLSKRKLKLKTKKAFMSPNEIQELEAEIALLEKNIEILEAEIERRSAEKEEGSEEEE